MKNLAIAALLGLVKVEAFKLIDASQIQLSDDETNHEIIDDSDVVIQIYDSNLEDEAQLKPPTADINEDNDEFVQMSSNVAFRPDPTQSPWAAKPTEASKNDITGAFTIHDSGSDYYDRVLPTHFDSSDKDDLLMRSIISTYSVEGKGDDGKPNGKFFITRSDINGLVDEVLTNNMGFKDQSKKMKYADENVPKIWSHFDMFGKGYIKAEEVPQFLRMLLGEVEVANSLQLQLAENNFLQEVELKRPIDEVVLQYRPTPQQVPWLAKSADKTKKSAIYKAFPPQADGMTDYERVVPETWDSTDKDDLLMRSVIKTYALEGRGEDDLPTGKFYLRLQDFYKVGEEVVATHLQFKGDKLKSYLDEHVPNIFKHFDNTNKGYIIAEEAPQALRLLLGEVEIQNGLQVQLDEDVSKTYRPNKVQQPWSFTPEPYVRKNLIDQGFPVGYEKDHLGYTREVPEKYQGDLLMKSLIEKWAIESRKEDGTKSGLFYLTKDLTKQAANEVVLTHHKFSQKQTDDYIQEHFDNVWKHYDVNHDGFIEVDRVAVLLRTLIGQVEAAFGLQ